MTQDMNQNMMNDKEQRIERLVNRFMTSCAKGLHALRYVLVVVMMVMGVTGVWGQSASLSNGDGYYYIINKGKPTDKVWYLKPATIEYEEGMPYLTTNTTGQVPGSLWIIKSNGNYHQIIHAEDMKYVAIHDAKSFGTGYTNNRARMHLEAITTPDDNNDFVFVENGSQYNIKHKTLVANVSGKNHIWWNPANDNNALDNGGEKGWQYLIGLYNENTGGSVWELTFVKKCVTPEFTYDPVSGKISISSITPGAEIHYTTDGTDPNESSPEYSEPFSATGVSVVKAIAYKTDFEKSEIGTRIVKPATPVFDQTNCDNSLSISCETEGAVIYYTTDDTAPNTNSTPYNGPFSPASGETVKAIAYLANALIPSSDEATLNYVPAFTADKPTISVTVTGSGKNVEITGSGTIYYTTNGDDPEPVEAQRYTGSFTIPDGSGTVTIKAIAKDGSLNPSCVVRRKVYAFTEISDLAGLQSIADNPDRAYQLTADIENATSFDEDITFSGLFDGGFHTIKGLNRPLFSKLVDEGTVKNVILDNVTVSNSSHAGAITNEAEGSARIYNCGVLSGTVSGSGYVGGLLGYIKSGSSVRVVNCYNYADVSSTGDYAAGIVGYNGEIVAQNKTVGNVRIALCMMYGSVSGATHISPVYGGNHVPNVQNFTEYNYYLYSNERDASGNRIVKIPYTTGDYNDQLAIDKDDYLTRYPFYLHCMNTHRRLAAFFLFGESNNNDAGTISNEDISEIGHWVIDKSKADYPIVEEWQTDTRKILDASAGATVNVRDGDGSAITSLSVSVIIGGHTYSATLPITDMDETNNDYTWGKVVLPFANEFEVNTDYTKVCTGWKITGVTGGKGGGYSNYNVSDRDCTSKDLFGTTGFIFAQGGNYIVPYNVSAITIEANFATAYYLSDATYDVGYDANYGGATGLGGDVPSGDNAFHGEKVYISLASALAAMGSNATPHGQAIVLVGNYHYSLGKNELDSYLGRGLTIMSIDEDNNQEPDYGWYSNNSADRPNMPPVRFDFLPMIPLGMAAHVTGSKGNPGIPIWKTRGWFEMTETCLCIMNQFELDSGSFNTSNSDTKNYRCIINGGYFTQMVRSNNAACNKVSYFQIGGNAYIKEFYPGNHSKRTYTNPLVPINVTGGEIEECFMTGYKSGGFVSGSNIYFWCAGGKIHKFLGAYMDAPNAATVNLTAKIDHALIGRFFGGGTSPNASITGAIDVTINNSKVDFYCGGPEFSSLTAKPTVKTTANGTTFGEYYGAGFGGTSITYFNDKDEGALTIADAATTTYPNYFNTYYLNTTNGRLKYRYDSEKDIRYGIGTCYKFEYLYHSASQCLVARHFTGYAQFSLATTGNVINDLTNCKIKKLTALETMTGEATKGDFYGAGCQGMVDGTVTSTLASCEVDGSAFGGGYQATSNEVEVYPTTAPTPSVFTKETALFSEFGKVTPNVFTWVQGTDTNENTAEDCNSSGQGGKLYTSKDITMADLGNVTGDISITIDGGSVTHDVYGGGNESKSLGDTLVDLKGNLTIGGNVFGGGNAAEVGGTAKVNIMYTEPTP